MILEKVTGRPYFTLLRERLLTPLRLASSIPVEGRVVPALVQGHAGAGNPFGGSDAMIVDGRFSINPQFEWTGGGIASTTLDRARWATLIFPGYQADKMYWPEKKFAVAFQVSSSAPGSVGQSPARVVIELAQPVDVALQHSVR